MPLGRCSFLRTRAAITSCAIDVYKDNVLVFQTSSLQNGFGTVSLYGEGGTVAQFNSALVRTYAAVEPSATLTP